MDLSLDARTGWPPDLRLLLDRFPRPVWPGHANLGGMARFWLDIHGGFRRLGDALQAASIAFHDGEIEAADFRDWFGPRFDYFLAGLEGHHQIEDGQFFPVFTAAEPRLGRGFDVLEADHRLIHAAMDAASRSAEAFFAASITDRDAMLRAADRYIADGDRLLRRLMRHLDDEEDLVIPVILDRGEGSLGL